MVGKQELPQMPGVEFCKNDNYPGYAFGSDGSVWNSGPIGFNTKVTGTWRPLKQTPTRHRKWAYYYVGIRGAQDKKRRNYPVHRLILEAFVGPRPEGMECRHLNGNSFDNRIDNLKWGTPAENTEDKKAHGRIAMGNQSPIAKLSPDKVREIIRIRDLGTPWLEIALLFGVHQRTARRAYKRKTWQHVKA